jgi:flagellar biosynthetic protein FliR
MVRFDEPTMFAFLVVFIRVSAMFLASPVFGGNSTPLQVRIFSCMAMAAALTFVVKPAVGAIPVSLAGLALVVAGEAATGLLIGSLLSLVLQACQMAGAMLDIEVGLAMSQTVNPVTGVPVTVVSQFKFMLATVIFLSANGHHLMIDALVSSYQTAPSLANLEALKDGIVTLLGGLSLLAVQISAPVLAVTVVVDVALAFVSKAVPQMQAFMVGAPAKLAAGFFALSLTLPPLVSGVTEGCYQAQLVFSRLFTAH